jgi:putative hydrolase of HD superfamily
MNKKILYLIQQAGMLMQMPRTHKRNLGTTFDTVASHSFHTGIIGYILVRMENGSHEEALNAMAMGVLHDLVEARTGDQDFITKNYSTVDEEK